MWSNITPPPFMLDPQHTHSSVSCPLDVSINPSTIDPLPGNHPPPISRPLDHMGFTHHDSPTPTTPGRIEVSPKGQKGQGHWEPPNRAEKHEAEVMSKARILKKPVRFLALRDSLIGLICDRSTQRTNTMAVAHHRHHLRTGITTAQPRTTHHRC